MADYKVIDAAQLDADMQDVADSIRTKGGTSALLAWPDGFKLAIDAIYTGIHGRHQLISDGLYVFTASEEVEAELLGDAESYKSSILGAGITAVYSSLVTNEDGTFVLSGESTFDAAALGYTANLYVVQDGYVYFGYKGSSSAFTTTTRYPIGTGTALSPVYYALSETEEFPEAHKLSGMTYERIWPTE